MIGGVGSGEQGVRYEERIKSRIEQLGLAEKVIWTGGYPSGSQDPSIYLRAADVCVLPMDRGISLNNSSLAAVVAHGLPVVATKGDRAEQLFQHGKNLFLCESQNPNALANALITVLDNPNLQEQLRVGALELAQEHFSWEKNSKRTLGILSQYKHNNSPFV